MKSSTDLFGGRFGTRASKLADEHTSIRLVDLPENAPRLPVGIHRIRVTRVSQKIECLEKFLSRSESGLSPMTLEDSKGSRA